jgi:DNA polymerase-4
MHGLGIQTGADLKQQSLAFLQAHFGKSGPWYYEIARGRDERPVRPDRERKSSGSETTFTTDLTDPEAIEAGVRAMADDVWAWCDETGGRGRTVTVKIKWADFQQSTRSRSLGAPVDSRAVLHDASLALVRSVYASLCHLRQRASPNWSTPPPRRPLSDRTPWTCDSRRCRRCARRPPVEESL